MPSFKKQAVLTTLSSPMPGGCHSSKDKSYEVGCALRPLRAPCSENAAACIKSQHSCYLLPLCAQVRMQNFDGFIKLAALQCRH